MTIKAEAEGGIGESTNKGLYLTGIGPSKFRGLPKSINRTPLGQ